MTASSASPRSSAPNAKIIHIDIDPAEMGKMIVPDVEIVGDAKAALTEINCSKIGPLETTEWLAKLDGYKKKFPLSYKKQGGLRMQQVIDELYQLTEGKAIVSTDVGQHQMWAAQFYKNDESYHWLSLRRRRHHGLRLPGGHRRAVRLPGQDRSSPSPATADSR